jgi:hypothetical protein
MQTGDYSLASLIFQLGKLRSVDSRTEQITVHTYIAHSASPSFLKCKLVFHILFEFVNGTLHDVSVRKLQLYRSNNVVKERRNPQIH